MRVDQNWTFFILGQWFCQNLRVKSLWDTIWQHQGIYKAVDVRQSKLLITLPSDAVSDEITGTGLDFSVPLVEIFFRVHKRTKHSKLFFAVYCILTMSRNINFFIYVRDEKFVFSGFERLVNIAPETINNDNNNNNFFLK